MKKSISVLVLILIATFAFSQSKQTIAKANEKVEELNQLIKSVNPDLALTKEQEELVRKLHIQKMEDVKLVNQSTETDEVKETKRKEIYKNTSKKISEEVLSKEQRQAFNKAKALTKEKEGGNKKEKE